ncbi:acetyltransferase (GNAT) family protein [Hoeflea sp. IMCC20628]|uniref:GNAT family N-acetyltransferase n=1 Tax=Hoeflea sp. IMCC20628 TaxID=1620421 RepID=UPI00063BD352|nr:GNAT family N-acetyltransferase [Hoeflea sp. IMCC20628]AKI03048.1 acetyltransferase (GNAT) family protein [Hoeflea sp. IMCC20628]
MSIIIDGYRPGALAGVVGLHMDYYAQAWDFGVTFETKLASELAEFLARFDPERDLFVAAWRGDALVGSISMDVSGGGADGAHLRWFVVSGSERGSGLGKQLMSLAIDHADRVAAGRVWLTTFAGLEAARALYERHGFGLRSQSDADQWHGGVQEQLFTRPAPGDASMENPSS